MGFMRGLSPYYMSGTPAINDFIKGLVASDPYLRDKGFTSSPVYRAIDDLAAQGVVTIAAHMVHLNGAGPADGVAS